jgi:hypothetical protein
VSHPGFPEILHRLCDEALGEIPLQAARRSRLALLVFGLLAVEAQQELIQLANGLQSLFEIVIVPQCLTNLRNLLGTQAHLAGLSAGITHIEDPEPMALTVGAFKTSRGVTDRALEQRAAEDPVCGGELGGEFVPFADGLFSYHQY